MHQWAGSSLIWVSAQSSGMCLCISELVHHWSGYQLSPVACVYASVSWFIIDLGISSVQRHVFMHQWAGSSLIWVSAQSSGQSSGMCLCISELVHNWSGYQLSPVACVYASMNSITISSDQFGPCLPQGITWTDLIVLFHNDFFPSTQTMSICSYVTTTNYWFHSNISHILLLHKTWGNHNKFDSTKSLTVYYWYVKVPQCGYMEHKIR